MKKKNKKKYVQLLENNTKVMRTRFQSEVEWEGEL